MSPVSEEVGEREGGSPCETDGDGIRLFVEEEEAVFVAVTEGELVNVYVAVVEGETEELGVPVEEELPEAECVVDGDIDFETEGLEVPVEEELLETEGVAKGEEETEELGVLVGVELADNEIDLERVTEEEGEIQATEAAEKKRARVRKPKIRRKRMIPYHILCKSFRCTTKEQDNRISCYLSRYCSKEMADEFVEKVEWVPRVDCFLDSFGFNKIRKK